MKNLSVAKMLSISLFFSCNIVYSSPNNIHLQETVSSVSNQQDGVTNDDVLKHLSEKYSNEISNLGLTENQLNSNIYVRASLNDNFVFFSNLKQFISVFYDLPNLQSVKVVKYNNYIGFKVKLAGRPSAGFALYQEGNEFFLKGVINEKGLIAAENIEEEGLVFNSYFSVAFVVFNKNGVKY
ncbi:hypothetical protein EJE23_09150 [Enterobacter chengduensis]|uniref:hypothetical protein n=1 Tax=Enterobacter chengduensis TaxID=2494701 RepID=UPI000F65C27D|nr:hypothetical protein [Enterobacter chengduensis]RSK58117.1 hypothetical protein EJE23_09150 [Enterobacter chengduensis]